MAPTDFVASLSKRYTCNNGYYGDGCYSSWSWYGRWILAGVVILVVLLLFFFWACINSRRRRRNGLAPMYGTGWMAGQQNAHYQNNPQGYSSQPPPVYGAPPGQSYPMQNQYTGNTFQTQDGYYGGQREGVQPAKDTYGNSNNNNVYGGNNDYAPPSGPPPAKTAH